MIFLVGNHLPIIDLKGDVDYSPPSPLAQMHNLTSVADHEHPTIIIIAPLHKGQVSWTLTFARSQLMVPSCISHIPDNKAMYASSYYWPEFLAS